MLSTILFISSSKYCMMPLVISRFQISEVKHVKIFFFFFRSQDTALDPGEDVALLSVSFEDAEATQVFPKLYLSPGIEQWVYILLFPTLNFNGANIVSNVGLNVIYVLLSPSPQTQVSQWLRTRTTWGFSAIEKHCKIRSSLRFYSVYATKNGKMMCPGYL